MSWHPLICSPESVRAYLARRKTQTRRVVKHIAALGAPEEWCHKIGRAQFAEIVGDYRRYCPHGVPGDGLYISEAVTILDVVAGNTLARIRYNADGTEPAERLPIPERIKVPRIGRYRGRIMPHEWARIFRELVEARVEQLQDISKADAIAEGLVSAIGDGGAAGSGYKWAGVGYHSVGFTASGWPTFHTPGKTGRCACNVHGATPAQCAYREWWDSLNAKRGHGWDKNDWVWISTTRETEQRPEFLQPGDVR